MRNFFALLLLITLACGQNEIFPTDQYDCTPSAFDTSDVHPKATIYQEILDRNRKAGIIGASMMIKDQYGLWVGASGSADLASGIDVKPCNTFLIASISKVFTATVIFSLVDDGLLSIDDPISKWLNPEIIDKLKNADESQIRHLLNHTSGLADYYTIQFELDRINTVDNHWDQYDILEYTYGKKPTNKVGETYFYSNTNFLLLAIIAEAVSGKSMSELYQTRIFNPIGLNSAYYGTNDPIPAGTVKGYVDVYGNGQYIESEFLYKDELGTGDGGIAINAYELGVFFESLSKGLLVSQPSLTQMTDWFDLPADWVDTEFGHFQNGYGLEHNQTPFGNSIGHTGGIDGFLSIAQYFPEHDATFVLLVNSGSYENQQRLNIYQESLNAMFEE